MPIYNLFLKILRSKIGQLITYIVIFLCITMIFLAKVASPSESEYKNIKLTVALCDKDCTTESKLLSKYIKENTESYKVQAVNEYGSLSEYGIPATTTGITTIKQTDTKRATEYNITGQRVSPTYQGIVVTSGKKHIQK